jgi:hypothetical protein
MQERNRSINIGMSRKGQISLFIIIGIVILAGVILFFAFRPTQVEEVQVYDIDGIEPFVESCLRSSVEDAISLISLQGGVLVPQDFLQTEYATIDYVVKEDTKSLVPITSIESDISRYVNDAVRECTNNFTVFTERSIAVEEGDVTATSVVSENGVSVAINYPLRVQVGSTTKNYEQFKVDVTSNLKKAYDIVNEISDKTIEEPEYVDLTYLSELGDIEILPETDNEIVYSVNFGDYSFLAAVKFKVNEAPIIDDLFPLQLIDGTEYNYELSVTDPEGDSFECSDDTAMFDISSDCKISFMPEVPGNYNVTITAEDVNGNRAEKVLEITVIE